MTSGDLRKTYPDEINKEIFFKINKMFKDSLKKEGAELFNGYRFKSTQSPDGTLITIYNKNNLPVLTTAVSNTDHDGVVWEMMHTSATVPVKTDINKPMQLPYIADRIEVGIVESMDAMEWTGDFARCMGWVILARHKIR